MSVVAVIVLIANHKPQTFYSFHVTDSAMIKSLCGFALCVFMTINIFTLFVWGLGSETTDFK